MVIEVSSPSNHFLIALMLAECDNRQFLVLALDQACVDACLTATPMPGSQLYDRMHSPDFHDHHDHFKNSTPESEWKSCLEHAEKIGIGTREYELIK